MKSPSPRSLGPRETRALLDRHGLHPKTRIGQHFVTDPNTVRKVVSLSGVGTGDSVIEIGPGLGALTLALVNVGASVIAIERDLALEPVLQEVVGSRARFVFADVRSVDLDKLTGRKPAVVVANLPYQIATSLVLGILEHHAWVRSLTVMVQREAGERLAAAPGTEAYGAVSAKIAYFATGSVVSRVSRNVFFPIPDVESVIVRLDRRPRPPTAVPRPRLWAVIEAGFAQRRKMVRAALRSGGWTVAEIEKALTRAEVDGEARAETLGLDAFAALAKVLPAR